MKTQFMRLIIILILLIGFFDAFSQDTIKQFYPGGKLHRMHIVVDSNLYFEKTFYETGQTKGELYGYLINREPLIKSLKTYYENGQLENFRNDTLEIRYHEDGSLFQTSQIRNFKRNGVSRTYSDNKLFIEMEVVDDKPNGWWNNYDTSGRRITSKAFYQKGKLEGPIKHYSDAGKLKKVVYYRNECPYKVEYFDQGGRIMKILSSRREIWLKEGKPINCK